MCFTNTLTHPLRMSDLASYLSSFASGGGKGKKQKEAGSEGEETINIFSIASGHLYERFLR